MARAIADVQLPCTISVTTESARSLYPSNPFLRVWVGKMNRDRLQQFLQEEAIVAILDASHPYAVEISQLAIVTATQHQIPYLRYERETVEAEDTHTVETSCPKGIYRLSSFEELVAGQYLAGERVLLTIGYRMLPLFRSWHARSRLFARILPSVTALESALSAGFLPDRLVAIRPPVSIELERALWQHWQITTIVTKASGVAGGEDIKRQLARELGVQLIAIARPEISYPQQTSQVSVAVEFCRQQILRSRDSW